MSSLFSKARLWPGGVVCCVLVIFGALILSGNVHLGSNGIRDTAAVFHASAWDMFAPEVDRALNSLRGQATRHSDLSHVYGMVVSHHIPATLPLLVDYYAGLKDLEDVRRFIIIGPDHNFAGETDISTSRADFVTSFAELKSSPEAVDKLVSSGAASVDEGPFDMEHSVGTQILVISRLFPEATVIPVILRSTTDAVEADRLAQTITSLMDEHTVLVASVDFSHYLSTSQAMSVDANSGAIIKNLDEEALPLVRADSDRSMEVFVKVMKSVAGGRAASDHVQVLNTNDVMQNEDYTTGYVFGYWGVI